MVLNEKENCCDSVQCDSVNYNSVLNETGYCAKGLLYLALSATVLRTLANCNSVKCTLEYLMHENLPE